jgi:hypothetical protein
MEKKGTVRTENVTFTSSHKGKMYTATAQKRTERTFAEGNEDAGMENERM